MEATSLKSLLDWEITILCNARGPRIACPGSAGHVPNLSSTILADYSREQNRAVRKSLGRLSYLWFPYQSSCNVRRHEHNNARPLIRKTWSESYIHKLLQHDKVISSAEGTIAEQNEIRIQRDVFIRILVKEIAWLYYLIKSVRNNCLYQKCAFWEDYLGNLATVRPV